MTTGAYTDNLDRFRATFWIAKTIIYLQSRLAQGLV